MSHKNHLEPGPVHPVIAAATDSARASEPSPALTSATAVEEETVREGGA